MNFLDLFSGIGGFRLGMEWAGHKCVGYVEFDKYARQAYQAMHNTEGEWTGNDIKGISDDDIRQLRGRVDCITGGFPCQAFSIAGKRGGFQDTRGTLFFEIARFTKQIQPRFLLLENVKGLLSHDKGETFVKILTTLDELGYDAEWQICNSKDFGVPQNRERIFIIGHSRQNKRFAPIFPLKNGGSKINEVSVQERPRAYINPVFRITMSESARRSIASCHTFRNLTPLEYFRGQGFPDEYFQKAKDAGISDSQLYKLAGNSVTVNVVYEIAKKLNGWEE